MLTATDSNTALFNRLEDTPLAQIDLLKSGEIMGLERELKRLNDLYGGKDRGVEFLYDRRSQIVGVLRGEDGQQAQILLHGANPISVLTEGNYELTYLSDLSQLNSDGSVQPEAPARGGLFACIPAFGGDAAGGAHGFGRISPWKVVASSDQPGTTEKDLSSLTLTLSKEEVPDSIDIGEWRENGFLFTQQHILRSDGFATFLTIENNGDKPFSVRPCFHSYYGTSDSYLFSIKDLDGLSFQSMIGDSTPDTQAERLEVATQFEPGTFSGDLSLLGYPGAKEIELLFRDVEQPLRLENRADNKVISVTLSGFSDIVAWNPFNAKGKNMADFKDGDHTKMFCVEPVTRGPIEISPGESQQFSQEITVKDLS